MRRSLAPSKRKLPTGAVLASATTGSSVDKCDSKTSNSVHAKPSIGGRSEHQASTSVKQSSSAPHTSLTASLIRRAVPYHFVIPTYFCMSFSSCKATTASFSPASTTITKPSVSCECYRVVYRKQTTKVHKTWDGDGFLVVDGATLRLKDHTGNIIGSGRKSVPLQDGVVMRIGQKEVEITERLSTTEMQLVISTDAKPPASNSVQETFVPDLPLMPKFKSHRIANTLKQSTPRKMPWHDPSAPGALVMPRPTSTPEENIVDVVVDPILSRKLRPHQREGVTFLYECVMGMRNNGQQGAILADEMGLGKTLQTIALIWTLLKQTPYVDEQPMRRVLIVCPASLVGNWKKEFKKWLGEQRIRVYTVQGAKADVSDFVAGRIYSVMVIGYERLRLVQQVLVDAKFDLIVCDEGHRLKNSDIQAAQILQSFATRRRVLLSGTPIQNDLSEFYAVVDFVNMGLLGKRAAFKKRFEDPIVTGRSSEATDADREFGNTRMQELVGITDEFILRRTADINIQYLPHKTEVVLFCRMSSEQTSLYRRIVSLPAIERSLSGSEAEPGLGSSILCAMTCLRKCASIPALISEDSSVLEQLESPLAQSYLDRIQSGKLLVLKHLLASIRAEEGVNKVVVVSNWMATLDVLERLCNSSQYSFDRLDGQTPSHKRQDIVDHFNSSESTFLFLLSSKAGGVGLNLTGASRLVLFDLDWNPSVDLQAMARVWRDGQRKDVTIYRMLSTGTIEERIFQRQITKMSLSNSVMDQAGGETNSFSRDELRDIFSLDEDTACLTHDCLGCTCVSRSQESSSAVDGADENEADNGGCKQAGGMVVAASSDLNAWAHYGAPFVHACQDVDEGMLGNVINKAPEISFVFVRD